MIFFTTKSSLIPLFTGSELNESLRSSTLFVEEVDFLSTGCVEPSTGFQSDTEVCHQPSYNSHAKTTNGNIRSFEDTIMVLRRRVSLNFQTRCKILLDTMRVPNCRNPNIKTKGSSPTNCDDLIQSPLDINALDNEEGRVALSVDEGARQSMQEELSACNEACSVQGAHWSLVIVLIIT